jgi:riboflavin kinase/FMN adenylyltransferase
METFTGKVIKGDGRGRELGFPTANLDSQLDIEAGVYAVWVTYNDEKYKGAMHIGPRPTIPGASSSVEVHILDFDKDIYNEMLTIEIVGKIRDVIKFNSLKELTEAIKQDCRIASELLAN